MIKIKQWNNIYKLELKEYLVFFDKNKFQETLVSLLEKQEVVDGNSYVEVKKIEKREKQYFKECPYKLTISVNMNFSIINLKQLTTFNNKILRIKDNIVGEMNKKYTKKFKGWKL